MSSWKGSMRERSFPRDTFGVHIESRVHEFVPNRRIGWFANGTGVNAYHAFLRIRTGEGCRIVTEKVVKGPGAVEFGRKQRARCAKGMIFGCELSSSAVNSNSRWTNLQAFDLFFPERR